MPQADLSVWVGVIAPALPVLGLWQREGTPLGRVSDAACRKRAAYSRSAWSSEAPISPPGNDPAMVPATVAAIPSLPLPTVDPSTPRRCRRAPAPAIRFTPMIAGHATGQNRAAITVIAVLIAAVFEWVIRGLPAGQRKPFSRPRPRRPKGPGLILSVARRDLAGAARLLCNFHACGPVRGLTPGSVGAQVLTIGMSSQRVV